jgi:hypothetical protein
MFANHPVVQGYAYKIDDYPLVSIAPNGSLPVPLPQSYWFSTSVDMSNLTNGYHKIAIIAFQYIAGPPPQALFNQTSSPITFIVQNPSSTPTLTPNVPEFPLLAILPLFVLVLSVAVVFSYRKFKSRKFD